MRHFLLTRKSSVIIQFESENVDDLARADLERAHRARATSNLISNTIFITILYRGLWYNMLLYKIVFEIYRIWNICTIIIWFQIYSYFIHILHPIPVFQSERARCALPNLKSWIRPLPWASQLISVHMYINRRTRNVNGVHFQSTYPSSARPRYLRQ